MSSIFTSSTKVTTQVKPRADATIRVVYWPAQPIETAEEASKEYRSVRLLEFHPDWDTRLKFRSTAYITPEPWMEHEAYEKQGVGYLPEAEIYISVREFMIHEEDRRELLSYCAEHANHGPLIIHPCPPPFPIFRPGARVVVLSLQTPEDTREYAGQRGAIVHSSQGGRSTVLLDSGVERSFNSLALRETK